MVSDQVLHEIGCAARWYSLITPPNRQVQRSSGLVVVVAGWSLLAGLVGPVPVVMTGVLAEG